jgi:hypothetical protein
MRTSITLSVLLLLATPVVARAQSSAAQAQQLFDDAQGEMKAGNFAKACTDFAASQKLGPAITTQMNLANCYEKNQQIASAFGEFTEVERVTRGDPNQSAYNKVAVERAAALQPRLSYLTINVPDDSKVDGLEIRLNGELVDPETWNRKLAEDGGHYKIEGKAPAHEPWSTELNLANTNDQKSVDVPKFKPMPIGKQGGTTVDAPSGLTGKRKAALGAGAVGVIAAIGAAVFELAAEGKYDDAKQASSDTEARSLTDDANGKRHLAIGAAGVGVAALGVGAFLWFTGAATHESRDGSAFVPTVSTTSVGMAWTGRF